jgi:tripartite-type tricarboxylate transporter receptor subunit TctC
LTFMIQTASEILPHVASGKLRALAVTGRERSKHLPDVPTMGQAGVPNLEATGWWGVFAPSKTPAAIIDRISSEVQAVMAMPEVIAALNSLGNESAPMSTTDFGGFFKSEIKQYADMAREFNIVVE